MFDSVLDLHFDSRHGSPYWIEQLQKKALQRTDFRTPADLFRLGPMDVEALRRRPLEDFIPAALLGRQAEMILSETGGTTGDPCRRVYLPEEFEAAFIAPWKQAVQRFAFPRGGRWLFLGPSGPHIIAQAARAFARAVGSIEPFSIDCDVRWIKQQQAGSMGHILYMEHLFQQAVNIIEQQNISVLFSTPPLLLGIAEKMSEAQRQQIQGIHTGGMAQTPEIGKKLTGLFPESVIIPGYGNSLFGVCFGKTQTAGESSRFFVHDSALMVKIVPLPENPSDPAVIEETVTPGQRGRVLFHRFDPSFLLINMLERDTAVRGAGQGEEYFSDIEALSFHGNSGTGVY